MSHKDPAKKREYQRKWELENADKVKEYRRKGRAARRAYMADYYKRTREARAAKGKIYRARNAEKIKASKKIYAAENREKIREKLRLKRLANLDRARGADRARYARTRTARLLQQKAYRAKNKAVIALRNAAYIKRTREQRNATLRAYRANNKGRLAASRKSYLARRQIESPAFLIVSRMRARLGAAMRARGSVKVGATMALVGCSKEALVAHLESLFSPGMNWGNYGRRGWHVDHIRPCAMFDMEDPEQQKACFHYSNLQPLWWYDNLRKSGRICERVG